MFILLEGVDGAGKTTLAERLVERAEERGLTGKVWHRGVPVRHPLEEYELDIETDYPQDADTRLSTLVVADRWHLGQLVYGGLYRDENLLGEAGAWHVDLLLQSIGALQFVVAPPIDVIRRRLEARGEDYLREEHVQRVYDHYLELVQRTPSLSLITRVNVPDAVLDTMIDQAVLQTEATNQLLRFQTYVGPRFPRILLLGERHSTGAQTARRPAYRAAFVPYPGTSGRWLSETLVSSTLADQPIGLANAAQENLPQLVRTLNEPRVVALGRRAAEYCEAVHLEHGIVPHPQFMRRFHAGQRFSYAEAIRHAADEQVAVMDQWR